jgi:hypothetical protein
MNIASSVSPHLRQPGPVQFGNLPADAARAAKSAIETRGQQMGIGGLSDNFFKTAGLVVVGLAAVGTVERLSRALMNPVETAVNKHTTKAAKQVKGKISDGFYSSIETLEDSWFALKRKFMTSPGKKAAQKAARQAKIAEMREKAATAKKAKAAEKAKKQAEMRARAAAAKEAKAAERAARQAKAAAAKAKKQAKTNTPSKATYERSQAACGNLTRA